ncbi:helix-turn-helix domain-containing protein [Devosia naphthalenivorans]|uniref:helix-turn-helix domain-containing protein n=1 Tax=Devosia naphthalenivorans TaxID=2082392 RepID=UPI002481F8D9|nr:helix-turn-helix transcriptional regulator [Devosia naphthalenivorans]
MSDYLASPAQIRAARALLNWSQADLANKSGTSRRTLATFESGTIVSPESLTSIVVALEGANIEFIADEEGEGVRINR